MKRVSAIIVAAGEGKRFGGSKQFVLLKDKPVLDWCLGRFENHKDIREIILVLNDLTRNRHYLERFKKIGAVVEGGKQRQDSVYSGLSRVDPKKTEIVLIHDGVRPHVSEGMITRVINKAADRGAAVPALPVEDTVKVVEDGEVLSTPDRTNLFRIQTPQGFQTSLLLRAFEKAAQESYYGTDEASLVERLGKRVSVVPGDLRNVKITTKADLVIAEAMIED